MALNRPLVSVPSAAGVFLLILFLWLGKGFPLQAQTFNHDLAFGIAYDLWQDPAGADFEADGSLPNFILDWDLTETWVKFRFGYQSQSRAKSTFEAANQSWEGKLITRSLLAAYRLSLEIIPKLEGFVFLGAAHVAAELAIDRVVAKETDTGIGAVTGGGALYNINDFGLGMQILIISRQASLADEEIAVGGNLLQLLASYHF